MRYFYLSVTVVLAILMLVVYFQNFSIGQTQQLYFLTSQQDANSANAMLYAFLFGCASTLSFILFLTGGRIDVDVKLHPKANADDEDEWK